NAGKLDQQLTSIIAGISRVVGKEIVYKVRLGSAAAYEEQIEKLQNLLQQRDFSPAIYEGKKEDFHVLPLTHLTNGQQFDNVHEILDAFYRSKATRDRGKQQMQGLIRLIKNELNKNTRKSDSHQRPLNRSNKTADFRTKGELLTANMHI